MTSEQQEPHYTAREVAGLPGMPKNPQCVPAAMAGKPARKRPGRGGPQEWPLSAFPLATQCALGNARDAALPAASLTAAPNDRSALAPAGAGPSMVALLKPALPAGAEERARYSARQCTVADMRLALLRWFAQRAAELGLSLHLAEQRYRAGQIAVPSALALTCAIADDRNGFRWGLEVATAGTLLPVAVDGHDPAHHARLPSRGTLLRWSADYTRRGWHGLVPKYKARDMRVPAWADEFLSIMQRPQKPSIAECYRLMLPRLPAGARRPSLRTVTRWYGKKYSALDRQRGRNTGSAMNPYKFHHARSSEGMLPLDEVHSDGWSTHFTAPHPISGAFVKLEVWHSHDVATRYVYPPAVGLAESATVILASIAAVIAADGVPAVWQTDNTGSVKNDRIEFDPAASIAARAGFTIVHNLAGNSQANGIAEEFGSYLDSRARELATYQGRDMDPLTGKRVLRITQKMVKAATREEYLALKAQAERAGKGIVFESYAQAIDWLRAIFAEYNERPHRSLPMIVTDSGRRNMTPAELRARFIEQGLWQPAPLSTESLADLLHPHERKAVVRGCVSVFGQRYHHPDLDHISTRETGQDVLVAYDINDGSRVWVKTLEGDPICEAKFYESRTYRSRSFMEMALERRADAQQKRLQRKFDAVEAQRPGRLFEAQPAAAGATDATDASALPENVIALPAEGGRPRFADDLSMLWWLAAHREQITDADWAWMEDCASRKATFDGEWRRLFAAPPEDSEKREARG